MHVLLLRSTTMYAYRETTALQQRARESPAARYQRTYCTAVAAMLVPS